MVSSAIIKNKTSIKELDGSTVALLIVFVKHGTKCISWNVYQFLINGMQHKLWRKKIPLLNINPAKQ